MGTWFSSRKIHGLRTSHYWLYDISEFKRFSLKEVKDYLDRYNSLKWTRNFREWEKEEVSKLIEIIKVVTLPGDTDKVRWIRNQRNYSTKCGYDMLEEPSSTSLHCWEILWGLKVPPKIGIFLWKYLHDILPLNKLLSDRLPNVMDTRCRVCDSADETRDHLFWSCSRVRKPWQ